MISTLAKRARNRNAAKVAKISLILLLAVFFQSGKLLAHTVDYFNSCGYICTGSTMSVSAHLSNTNSSSKYNWQYRDNSNVWKCFVSGSNTINGVVFSVSGVSATGTLTTSPTLSIAGAKINLEDVEVRLLIADGGLPCTTNPSYTIWGGDKSLRLHVLSGSDCSAISTFCSMGGCIGNTLSNTDGYYGGFEVGSGSIGIASTDYTNVASNSSCGQYSIINNPQKIYSSFPMFAPRSGNYMMYVDGAGTAGKRAWYKTVSVTKGSQYQFSAWIANANNTNNQKAIVRLKISGSNVAEVTKTVTAVGGDWQNVNVNFIASQTETVTLSISDDNLSCPDNDFVIDDICFKCNGPATILNLGNLIWNDLNANGLKDANEPGVPNATVKLYRDANNDDTPDSNTPIATTTTGSTGLYGFSNLSADNYIVGVIIPTGYTKGPASTIDPGNNVDNDNNGVFLIGANQAGGEVRSKAITLSAGDEPTNDGDGSNGNLTLDIPLCGNSQLGDFVWNDKNANGIQDSDEPGIEGVTVTLAFPDGVTTSIKTTDANGKYLFTALAPGNYKVTFSTPSGYTVSPSNQGSDDAKDSDPVGGSVTVAVPAGSSNLTIDAGFYIKPLANLSLGNQVWNDYDGDGKRDDNEPGIGGATVSLYTDNNSDNLPDGAAIKTTMTDVQGHYQFTSLAEGRYIASLPILPGYQQSPNNSTQATSPFPDNNIDNDDNLVRLVGPNGPGGIVYTNAITLTANQEPTDDGDGANGNNTFDLAECGNSFIGDFVWNDLNGNGIQDAGEPGINGVLVTITFEDGRTATTATLNYNAPNNANDPQFDGYYNFPNLGPGTYKITFATPAGLVASPSNQGSNDAKDSDPVNGGPVTVVLAANQSDFTIDAGFTSFTQPPTCPNLGLGNIVFIDLNENGTKEYYEPGISGLTVKLYADNDGNNAADGAAVATLTTADDGTYYFGGLAAGKYIVSVALPNGLSQGDNGNATPDDNQNSDNNGIRTVNGEVYSNYITLTPGGEPTNDGSDNNSNLTLDLGLKFTTPLCSDHCFCHNDCNHTGCGHANCGKASGAQARSAGPEMIIANDVTKTSLTVFPNPTHNYFTIKVNAMKEGTATVRVTDAMGRTIASKNMNISYGSNSITFNDLKQLGSGTYHVQLIFNNEVFNQKVVIAK